MAGLIADRATWQELGAYLSRDLLLLKEERRVVLSSRWQELYDAESRLDDRMLLGVIGGTGVGKSTLINALAGAEISAASDERPTTRGVIVYSHQSAALPEALPTEDVAQPLRRHQSAWLERVIVLDFPDFDSVEAPHHEIVQRFCPHLDVLVILVDDVKYADERLFEVASGLPQSEKNLHIVLNKLDVLKDRYPECWASVVEEILADLRGKLRKHAHLDLGESRFLALSAYEAYKRRLGLDTASETPVVGSDGDGFHALEAVLSEFQEERRRRAAKELNLGARQSRLLKDLQAIIGTSGYERMMDARATLESRTRDLGRMLELLSESVLSGDERRLIAAERLRSRIDLLGFPLDFLLTLKSVFRWREKRSKRHRPTLSVERLRRHFRPYLNAIGNVQQDLQLDLHTHLELIDEGPVELRNLFLFAVGELGERTAEWETQLKNRWRIWNHVLSLFVLFGCVGSLLQRALDTAVTSWVESGEIPWGEVGSEALVGLVAGLSPFFLVGIVVGVVLAYALVAMIFWTRQVQRLQRTFQDAERTAGDAVGEFGDERLNAVRTCIEQWLQERHELSELLDRLQHDTQSGSI